MSNLKLCIIVFLLMSIAVIASDIPQTTNIQGRLTNPEGSPLANDTLEVTFSIYDAETDGTSLWEETDTVRTDKFGLFSIILGLENPIAYDVFDGVDRWLAIQVESDPEMTPRQPLTSVPYAFQANHADTADYAYANGGIVGSGSPNYIAKFTGPETIGNSVIYEINGDIGIGTMSPGEKLEVNGDAKIDTDLHVDEDAYIQDNLSVYDGKIVIAPTGSAVPFGYKLYIKGQARIDSNLIVDGKLGIGSSNPTTQLYVDGNVRFEFDYNSGWINLSAGNSLTLTHSLNGDENDYIVFVDCGSNHASGLHQANYGSNHTLSQGWRGIAWHGLTSSQITITRGAGDNNGDYQDCDKVRVRIIKNEQ
jgi:hypothetical protein